MRFVLADYGSRGDVEPLAALGRELLQRGHDVSMAVPPNMLGFVESAGLAAVAFGSDPPEPGGRDFAANTNIQHPISIATELVQHLGKACAEWGTTLLELADGADLLLTGKFEQELAANVAEYYGIPVAALHFFPVGQSSLDGLAGRITKDAEETQRRALGLPEAARPAHEPLEIQAYDELCFPEQAAEWAQQGRRRPFVGALTLELPTEADAEALSWIAAGTPPIYFGFGSNVRLPSPAETAAVISAACARLGERALICAGASDFVDIPHFDNVKVVGTVNHAAIFPACRAVVHQGGAGTTAAGMRAGIPALVLWFSLEDQPIWASAVERLKVGSGRAFSASTLDSLVADLQSILTPECRARAQDVAARMTTPAKSASSAADLLEETVRVRFRR
jgi:UDP:flavonoid glycosyltransferase YjiC (YdhE family)